MGQVVLDLSHATTPIGLGGKNKNKMFYLIFYYLFIFIFTNCLSVVGKSKLCLAQQIKLVLILLITMQYATNYFVSISLQNYWCRQTKQFGF